jgi:hypothetical protein
MPSLLENRKLLLIGKIFWPQAGLEPALRGVWGLLQYHRTMEPLGLTKIQFLTKNSFFVKREKIFSLKNNLSIVFSVLKAFKRHPYYYIEIEKLNFLTSFLSPRL